MRHHINPIFVYISAFTTGLLLTYIAVGEPANPIPLIIGTGLCAAPMVRAIVLATIRWCGYPY